MIPPDETVQLHGIFPPCHGFDHEIGRQMPLTRLPENGFLPTACRVAGEKLRCKSPRFPRDCMVACEGMPPPVAALSPQFAFQHVLIPFRILYVGHDVASFCLLRIYCVAGISGILFQMFPSMGRCTRFSYRSAVTQMREDLFGIPYAHFGPPKYWW